MAEPAPADAAVERARLLLALRRPEEAARLLQDALAGGANRAALYGELARAMIALSRPAEALAAATELVRLRPEDEWGYRLSSRALVELGRRPEAVRAAAEGVRLAPQRWETHVQLAAALAARRAWRAAAAAARQAVQLAPEEPATHSVVGSVALGRRRYRAAERAYRRVLELDPNDATARGNLALVTLRRGRLAQAASGFADAIATDPRGDWLQRNLAVTLTTGLFRLSLLHEASPAAGWTALSKALPPAVVAAFVASPLVLLAAAAGWGWWSLPRRVRRYAGSMLRTDRRLWVPLGANLAGSLALTAAVGLLLAGWGTAAKVTLGVASVLIFAAVVKSQQNSQRLARAEPSQPVANQAAGPSRPGNRPTR
jgi:tetratricopeptide (TPR) repeat protein